MTLYGSQILYFPGDSTSAKQQRKQQQHQQTECVDRFCGNGASVLEQPPPRPPSFFVNCKVWLRQRLHSFSSDVGTRETQRSCRPQQKIWGPHCSTIYLSILLFFFSGEGNCTITWQIRYITIDIDFPQITQTRHEQSCKHTSSFSFTINFSLKC